jgi:hypothetical protein|tara:strand:- start:2252 stop:2437 length:186 start_codon:yes stop_codon:yes gene_type:complete
MGKKSRLGYIRRIQHVKYVEQMVVDRRSKVISSALMFGKVNAIDRELFIKYNDYLMQLRST